MTETRTPTKKTLMDRMRERLAARREHPADAGSLLLDVLFGTMLIAIIASIATTAWSTLNERASLTAANQLNSSLYVALTGYQTDNNGFPADLTALNTAITSMKVNKSVGTDVKWYIASGSEYVLCSEHVTNGTADAASYLSSAKGGITKKVRGVGCSGTPSDYAAAVTAAS